VHIFSILQFRKSAAATVAWSVSARWLHSVQSKPSIMRAFLKYYCCGKIHHSVELSSLERDRRCTRLVVNDCFQWLTGRSGHQRAFSWYYTQFLSLIVIHRGERQAKIIVRTRSGFYTRLVYVSVYGYEPCRQCNDEVEFYIGDLCSFISPTTMSP